jgi:hypothetical protein
MEGLGRTLHKRKLKDDFAFIDSPCVLKPYTY